MDNKEYHKIKSAEHYVANKERYKECARKRKTVVRDWLKEYKKTLNCNRCPENDPVCLVFHHKDPVKKEINISAAISNRWTIKRVLKEINKCEVLCSNCHLKHHCKNGFTVAV